MAAAGKLVRHRFLIVKQVLEPFGMVAESLLSMCTGSVTHTRSCALAWPPHLAFAWLGLRSP